MNQVYQKLNAARADFHNHKLIKTGRNDFAHYSFFELSDFLPHALTAFADHGLCGVVSFGILTAQLRIVDIESGADIVITSPMSTAALKGCHPVQNLGAVQSYTRRYLWSAAMELVEEDVLDSTTGKDNGTDVRQPPPLPTRPTTPKKPAPRPTAAEDEEIWDVVLDSITPSEGVGKNGKPFKRWQLKWNGGQISTFDKKLGESLEPGESVRLIVKQDGKFHKLIGIEEAHEELVKKPEVWEQEIINVEKSENGKYWQVFLNDIEHPWVGTTDEGMAMKAARWIEQESVVITVKQGKGDIWELVSVPDVSLLQEFGEKEAE